MAFVGSAIGMTIGIGIAVAAVPVGLWALGFIPAGIAARMSLTALASGLVAIAQLLAAAGVPKAVTAALSAAGGLIRWFIH